MSSHERSLQETAEEYFASISPTAKRIMEERAYVRQQFEVEWDEMTYDEREDLIYDYLVSPKLQEKYSSTLKIGGDAQSFPKLIIDSGARMVEDDAVSCVQFNIPRQMSRQGIMILIHRSVAIFTAP